MVTSDLFNLLLLFGVWLAVIASINYVSIRGEAGGQQRGQQQGQRQAGCEASNHSVGGYVNFRLPIPGSGVCPAGQPG